MYITDQVHTQQIKWNQPYLVRVMDVMLYYFQKYVRLLISLT